MADSERPSVEDVRSSLQLFSSWDYAVFGLMLSLSASIGFYWGFMRRQNELDYTMGGRRMKIVPISMSLVASYVSAISLLGVATETYVYGIQYNYVIGGLILMTIIHTTVFLPVSHELKITSAYEYLEKRFDKRLRMFGSVFFCIGNLTWLPIVIYVPTLALNQVSGLDISVITPVVCLICIFYTCVGGLQAVIWTDVMQTCIMYGTLLFLAVKGTFDAGGITTVFQRNWESGRIEAPDLDLDPTTRHTIWNLVLGSCISYISAISTSQSMMQRYLSLPNMDAAKKASYFFVGGLAIITLTSSYCGILTYATYHDCDPLTTTLARAKDQLLPLLVMDVLRGWPGFCGLFIAGAFSAALSSLSTGLNSMAVVVLEDFYKPYGRPLNEKQRTLLTKCAVVVIGIICTSLVFLIRKVKTTILQLNSSLHAINSGPMVGIYIMGLLFPKVHSVGALVGGLVGLLSMSWIAIGSQYHIASSAITFKEMPVSIDGCHYNFSYHGHHIEMNPNTAPIDSLTEIEQFEDVFILYRLSYIWFPGLGALITTLTGLLVSTVWKPRKSSEVNPQYLAPFLRKYYSKDEASGDDKKMQETPI